MAELLTLPPPPEAIAAMVAIPRTAIAPSILATQQGPHGDLGPEEAGAVLMLQATFSRPEGAASFWAAAVPLMELLVDAPGFIVAQLAGAVAATALFRWLVPSLGSEARSVVVTHPPATEEAP